MKEFKLTFKEPVTIKVIQTEFDEIGESTSTEGLLLSDGTIINDYHHQDCCEEVYADWLQLLDTDIMDKSFTVLGIQTVVGSGINILLYDKEYCRVYTRYFIPCYNSQNGQYGDDLELVIIRDGNVCTMDITDCKIDDIR